MHSRYAQILTALVVSVQLVALNGAVDAQSWDGGGANTNWSTGANWTSNSAPGSNRANDFEFGSVALASPFNTTANNTSANFDLNSITFNNTAGASFTLSGSEVDLRSSFFIFGVPPSITQNSNFTQTITLTLDINEGPLNLNGNGTGVVVLGNMGTRGNDIDKSGTSTFAFNGAVTGGGTTTISAGTLSIGNGGTTGSYDGGIVNDATLIFNRSNAFTHSGNISGTGVVTKLGGGVTTLSGANSYSGGTNINAGTLALGSSGAIGTTGTISFGGGTLQFSASNTTDYSARFSNAASQAYSLDTNSQNVTLATGLTSSGGTLTKLGAGTLTLTGANTYSGTTTISAGTLSIGSGGTTGSVAGNIVDNSALFFNRSDSLTYAGAISGTGTVTKLGAGTLTFTGSNTYGGATTISDGALSLGNGGTTGSITGAVVNNASLIFNRSNALAYSGAISGTGSVTQQGAGTTTLSGSNSYSGGTTISGGVLALGSSGAIGTTGTISFTGGTLQFSASNTTDYSARFSNAAGQAYSLDTNGQSVTLATGLTSSGGTLTKLGAGTLTITGTNTYSGTTTISAGTLSIGSGGTTGSISGAIMNNSALVFNRSNALTHSGNISGTGSVTKNGGGALTLSGTNSYAGATDINAGSIVVGSTSALGTTAGSTTIASGATLSFQGGINYANNEAVSMAGTGVGGNGAIQGISGTNTFGGAITMTGNSSIGVAADLLTLTNTIAGGFNLTKLGAGNLTLSAANTYGGTTTISAGTLTVTNTTGSGTSTGAVTIDSGATLAVGNGGAGGSVSGDITDNGTLAFNRSDDSAYAGAISGTGVVTKNGAGTLTLSGANSYSGDTTVNNGTLLVTNASGSGTGTGDVTVDSGATLAIGDGGANGAVAGDITDNGTLEFNRSDDVTYAGLISGSGVVIKNGGGALELTNANTYGGGTTINSGTLLANNASGSATGTGAVTVENGGTLAGNGAVTGAVTVNGGGTLAPGSSIESLAVGALTFNVDGNGSATFAADLNTDVALSVAADLVNANGNLSIVAGAILSLVDLGNTVLAGSTKLTLISYSGTWNNGIFFGLADGSQLTVGLNTYTIDYDDTLPGANFGGGAFGRGVTLTTIAAVPEASAFLFGSIAFLILGADHSGRRRGRHQV